MTFVHVYQEWDIFKENNKEIESNNKKTHVENIPRPSFGFLLQEGRIKKRMTTMNVANHLEIDPKIISLYENGTESPSETIAMKLRELLDI